MNTHLFTLHQKVTITQDVHWTDDNDQERITPAPVNGTITAIDPRPDVTIYEIILDNDAGWFLHEPTADGPIVIPTTAPWSEDPEGLHATTIEDATGTPICDVYGSDREANARLVAAAPDLLATLTSLVQAGHFDDDQTKRIRHELLDRARAAIARATLS